MAKQLSQIEAIEQNQKMILEWAAECKMDGLLAFYMATIDTNTNVRIFRSEAMDCEMLIRQLRYVADSLEQNPF